MKPMIFQIRPMEIINAIYTVHFTLISKLNIKVCLYSYRWNMSVHRPTEIQ